MTAYKSKFCKAFFMYKMNGYFIILKKFKILNFWTEISLSLDIMAKRWLNTKNIFKDITALTTITSRFSL